MESLQQLVKSVEPNLKQWWEFEYLEFTKVLQQGNCLHLSSESDNPVAIIKAIAPVTATIATDGIKRLKLHGQFWALGIDLPIDGDTAIAATILEYLRQDPRTANCQLKVLLKSHLKRLSLMFEGEMPESLGAIVVLSALRQIDHLNLVTVLVSARLRGHKALSWTFSMDLAVLGLTKTLGAATNSFLDDDFAIAESLPTPIPSSTYKFKQQLPAPSQSISLLGFLGTLMLGLAVTLLGDRIVGQVVSQYAAPSAKASTNAPAKVPAKISTYQYNNEHLNQKLALLEWQMSKSGKPPQVLVVGSSRALRGIEPQVLEQSLQTTGHQGIEVFNMGINGATAQVVDLQLTKILASSQLPKMIIWADGVRAFNNNRDDNTYREIMLSPPHLFKSFKDGATKPEKILTSPSMLNLLQAYPQREQVRLALTQTYSQFTKSLSNSEDLIAASMPTRSLDMDPKGFVAVGLNFEPKSYFQLHPYVPGVDDLDYRDFSLDGDQIAALERMVKFCAEHHIRLVFINMPLHTSYLDAARQKYDQVFSDRMQNLATSQKLTYVDLSKIWSQQPQYFSDPSHLNHQGAIALSRYLATYPEIPWREIH